MYNMNWQSLFATIKDTLDGKKTYLLVVTGVVYIVGSDLGWWPLNEHVLALLGLGSAATIRAGVSKMKRK